MTPKRKRGYTSFRVINVVLDASAVLALLLGEPGGEKVKPHLNRGSISALNYAEVLARTARLCDSLETAKRWVDRHPLHIVNFDSIQATIATSLLPVTKPLGLSLADRACLALGLHQQAQVRPLTRRGRN